MRLFNSLTLLVIGEVAQAGVAFDFGTVFASILDKRASTGPVLSPDNTCGSNGAGLSKNFTCNVLLTGGGACCSAAGYCGMCPEMFQDGLIC
jgi:hypothetical protein